MVARSAPVFGQFGGAFVGRVSAAAINLFALIVYSRILSPSDFGLFALGHAAAIILSAVFFYWLRASIVRMIPGMEVVAADFRGALAVGYGMATAALCIVALVALPLIFAIVPNIGLEFPLIVLLSVVGESQVDREMEQQRARSKINRYSALAVARASGALIASLIATQVLEPTGPMVLFGHAVGCLIVVATVGWTWRNPIRLRGKLNAHLKEMWTYGMPLSVSVALRLGIERIDRFLIAFFMDTEAAGIYVIAFELAHRALAIPLMIVNVVLYPRMAAAWTRDRDGELPRLMRLNWESLFSIGLPSALGLIAISNQALLVLFGAAYGPDIGARVVAIAAIAVVLEAFKLYHADLAFMLTRRTMPQILISALGVLTVTLGCVVLIPVFGILGAATAVLIGYATMLGVSFRKGRTLYRVPTDFGPLLPVVLASAPMVAAVYWFPDWPGPVGLTIRVALGIGVYVALAAAFDVGGCRVVLRRAMSRMRRR